MKRQFTKSFALLAMGIVACCKVSAQYFNGGDYNHSLVSPSSKGSEWTLLHLPKLNNDGTLYTSGGKPVFDNIHYYMGGYFDRVLTEKFNGGHWKGEDINDLTGDEEIYFCNVKTGEYLQVGDYWGQTAMTNHVGLPYKLVPALSIRKRQNWAIFRGDEDGYWICPVLPESDSALDDLCIGRMHKGDGVQGHFEHNRYFALRQKDEYEDGKILDGSGNVVDGKVTHPGGFLFRFHEVNLTNGKKAYVIYTHRRTEYADASREVDRKKSEYWDRESYLLVRSAGHLRTGYNTVRFKKFAGQMYGKHSADHNATFGNEKDNPLGDEKEYYNGTDKLVKYLSLENAWDEVEKDSASLWKIVTKKERDRFRHVASDAKPVDVTHYIKNPKFYTSYDYNVSKGAMVVSNNPVITENDIVNGSTYVLKSCVAPGTPYLTESSDGTFYEMPNNQNDVSQRSVFKLISSSNGTWKIQNNSTGNYWGKPGTGDNYANLQPVASASDAGEWTLNFDNGRAFLRAKDVNNVDHGIDRASEKLVYYTTGTSDVKAVEIYPLEAAGNKQATWNSSTNHWEIANSDRKFGWIWYDNDRLPHVDAIHHVHPYDAVPGDNGMPASQDAIETTRPEYHKIGTGFYYRYMTKDQAPARKEHYITLGNDANYVGSVWRGTGNLQQSITGLREGLYVVCVKGFYAPHDMMKYTMGSKRENPKMDDYDATGTAPDEWKNQAVIENTPGTKKWRRSFDSYLFAWSEPETEGIREEVRRMLPSIYEGAVKGADLGDLSKQNGYMGSEAFKYTEVGTDSLGKYINEYKYMKDSCNLAKFGGNFFGSGGGGTNWFVPKTLSAAGRWFNAADSVDISKLTGNTTYENTANYRVALPVYVGSNGNLTIGVDHTRLRQAVTFSGGTYQYEDENGDIQTGTVDREYTIPASYPDEWICFDDFELIYLGKVEPDEFVIDENHNSSKSDYNVSSRLKTNGVTGEDMPNVPDNYSLGGEGTSVRNKNNTQWIDIFDEGDIAISGREQTTVKTVVIRRTLTKDGFSSIVLPINLTYKQAKEGFGEGVQISRLDDFTGRTIMYKAVQTEAQDDDIVMFAGIPYIIKPSIEPVVPAPTLNGKTGKLESVVKYKRPRFSLAYSSKAKDVAGYYLRDEKRNYEVETEMLGPIYVINKVTIKSGETFPAVPMIKNPEKETEWIRNKYKPGGVVEYTAEEMALQNDTLAYIKPFKSDTTANNNPLSNLPGGKNKTYYIKGKEHLGKFRLVEKATYYGGQKIPANSYFHSNGKMYYTTIEQNTTKGMYTYLQMQYADPGPTQGTAYAKPFINSDDFFVEVLNETSGVEEVDAPKPDGKIEIYDLMGRKVKNPRPGTIYIMNGVKVMWK